MPKKPSDLSKTATVADLPPAVLEHVEALETDLKRCDQLGRLLVYGATRIGLRLILLKASVEHGQYLMLSERLAKQGASERTLRNYRNIAEDFLKQTGIKVLAATKGLLPDTETKLKPILDEQLELFSSQELGQMQGILKKLKTWVNGRSLTEIYRALAAGEHTAPPPPAPDKSPSDPREVQIRDMRNALSDFRKAFGNGYWKWLPIKDLKEMDSDLETKRQEIAALLANHN